MTNGELQASLDKLRKLCERDSEEECGNRPCSCAHSIALHLLVREELPSVLDALEARNRERLVSLESDLAAAQQRIAELEQQVQSLDHLHKLDHGLADQREVQRDRLAEALRPFAELRRKFDAGKLQYSLRPYLDAPEFADALSALQGIPPAVDHRIFRQGEFILHKCRHGKKPSAPGKRLRGRR